MEAALAKELADKVREGAPLRDSIAAAGLPVKQTLLDLRRNHREQFRQAKRDQVAERTRRAERVAEALEVLRAPEPETTRTR